MKSPVSVRRFFAYVVLACWIGVTLLSVGDSIADEYATAIAARETIAHARPEANNVAQAEADVKASQDLLDFETNRRLEAMWGLRIWLVLTLFGAALFAERSDASSRVTRLSQAVPVNLQAARGVCPQAASMARPSSSRKDLALTCLGSCPGTSS